MALFMPDDVFFDVTRITPEYLTARQITALVLDVDNTLTAYKSQQLSPSVQRWLRSLQNAGIELVLSSNNFKKRVEPFAKKAGLRFVSFSLKPSAYGLSRAKKLLCADKNNLALVGDQIFTDCLAANLYGITMLLVRHDQPDKTPFAGLRRRLEQPFLHRYFKKGGTIHE